jgi:hypothetical protein
MTPVRGIPRIVGARYGPSVTDGGTFVPEGFVAPHELSMPQFRLLPLAPEHNEADYAAWTSSIDHIRTTPGFVGGSWPHPMSLDENRGDLTMHAAHFTVGVGFTYTVVDPDDGDVIGCVYIYPAADDPSVAYVRSWVRASKAELDEPLARAVSDWLASDAWPFPAVQYEGRD